MRTVFALIRFSFIPSDNLGFALTKDRPLEEKKRVLFAPARLDRRFALFEAVCLPSLLAQPADRFGAIILTSDALPGPYRERLDALLAPHPHLVAAYEPPAPSREAFVRCLDRLPDPGGLRFTCRLDDDDALASNYTELALPYVAPRWVGHCISFARGLQGSRVGGRPRFWESFAPLIGAGVGHVAESRARTTIYDCGHHMKLWERQPTLVDGREPAYLVTLHDHNDSTLGTRRTLKDRLLRRRRHRNPQRMPPATTLSLADARARYPNFAPLASELACL